MRWRDRANVGIPRREISDPSSFQHVRPSRLNPRKHETSPRLSTRDRGTRSGDFPRGLRNISQSRPGYA